MDIKYNVSKLKNSKLEEIKPENFQEYLLSQYKIKAIFEAEE